MRLIVKTLTAAAVSLLSQPGLFVDASLIGDIVDIGERIADCLGRHGGTSGSGDSVFSKNVYQTSFPGVTWDEDKWLLSTTDLKQGAFQARASVANGYLGINVAATGPFFEFDTLSNGDIINGWPLFSRRQTFATVAGFWDSQPTTEGENFPWLSQYGGDSAISGIPHWSGLKLDLGNGDLLDATVDNKTISNFRSTYDYKAGLLSWTYDWTPASSRKKLGAFKITYRLFVNKLHVNQAVVDLEIVPPLGAIGTSAIVANVLDGYSAVRTDFVASGQDGDAIYSAVRPNGIANVTAYVYAEITGSGGVDLSRRKVVLGKSPYVHANESSIAQTVPVKFSLGQKVKITKFVGAASSDAFKDPRQTAKNAVIAAVKAGYTKSLKDHVAEWAAVMPEDSVDRFADPKTGKLPQDEPIIDDAIMAVVNPFYMLQNTVSKNAIKAVDNAPVNVDSISVGGLTSDSYAGMIFWDAELSMQPGLVVSFPEAAERITNYRVNRYGQAKANAQTAFTGSQNQTFIHPEAAIYSWTSGRFGNCTATGPCWDYQYHLEGDIGIAMVNQWVVSGDTQFFQETLFPIYDSMATLYANLLKPNGTSWTLTNMTDPDEYANLIDAGGYTMPLIAEMLTNANTFRKQFGLAQNETWNDMAANVLFLRENGVTLEFTSMNGSAAVKQADVILLTYPLSYTDNYSSQDALNDLDYYANRQSPDGPAMTYAFFSIVANQISPSGCSSYTYAQNSFKPYVRAPFYQLGEQQIDDANHNGGTHPAYPFLTGHGGAYQVVLFGYLGLRLVPDDILHIDPSLPPQIPYLGYRTFYWRGWPVRAWSNYTHTTIGRATNKAALDTADARFAKSAITIHVGPEEDATAYTLPLKGSIVIPNRKLGTQATIAGNIAQCQPAKSPDDIAPGQFAIGAVDGASSTKWQPASAEKASSLTVSISEEGVGSLVTGFYFDWAQHPPVNATIVFHSHPLKANEQDQVLALWKSHDGSSSNNNHKGSSSDVVVISSLNNIAQSDPYNATLAALDIIAMPTSNTTNVTLSKPVRASRYASLFMIGNQGLSEADLHAKNGTGATVAEWAILGEAYNKRGEGFAKRRINVRDAAMLSRGHERR